MMRTDLMQYGVSLSLGSLDAYIQGVQQIPLLSLEEEQQLTNNLYYKNDITAAKTLIMAHLRYVVRVARSYAGYGLQQGDLIQEGNIGLMKAVKRFNPHMGARLVTFAMHWIKAEIHEFILKNWRIVKIATTKAQRKLFFNIRKASQRLDWLNKEEITAMATDLKVPEKEVRDMQLRIRNYYDEPFDAPHLEDEDNVSKLSPSDYLTDATQDPAHLLENSNWTGKRQHGLADALAQLDARALDIIQQRWLNDKKATLHELAAKYKISAERIRQLEQQTLKHLKGALSAA
jgi:RNA polymerase sigma-32 factor